MKLQSILGRTKLGTVLDCLAKVKHLPGDIAELGVYKGGTAQQMYWTAPLKHLWLFDTFAGMPVSGPEDHHQVGEFADISVPDIEAAFLGKPVTFCVGVFPKTTELCDAKEFCFVHLDADQYEVTKAGLEYFYHKLTPGGMIVLDDYNWVNCRGVKKALDEFGVSYAVPTQHQAVIVK